MKYRVLLTCLALSACVASEAGNPAQRCDDQHSCGLDQACYRGFCIDDWESVDPASASDAGIALNEADASEPMADAASAAEASFVDAQVEVAPPDAAAQEVAIQDAATQTAAQDAAVPDTAVQDAAAQDAAAQDAAAQDAGVRDAAVRDAGLPDAGMWPCLDVCKPDGLAKGDCKKCIEDAFGQGPEQLCGKPSKGKSEEGRVDTRANDPFCILLCLGAAAAAPGCAPLPLCSGTTCGGKP